MEVEFLEVDLPKVAKKLKPLLHPGDIVGFSGQLAAGKTTLIRAIVELFGYRGRVSSPTFVIEHRYPTNGSAVKQIIHLDLYRLNQEDLSSIDWAEYQNLKDTLVLVEWPERLSPGLIKISKSISIEVINEKKRRLTLQ
jgi:tRNA threonylcarbamoyladenosine biosynthesis protein TsaE